VIHVLFAPHGTSFYTCLIPPWYLPRVFAIQFPGGSHA
jgi:hypothetical protein